LGHFASPDLFGCRYNVRETGFVDTLTQSYVLVCYVGEQTPLSFGKAFLSESESALAESNVTYELVNVNLQPEHPALRYLSDPNPVSLPLLQLISLESSTVALSIEWDENATVLELGRVLRKMVCTPARDELVRQLTKHYGVILLMEGLDSAENQRAARAIQQAVEMIRQQMKFMPKPIAHGPVLFRLGAEDVREEEVLMGSLGIGEDFNAGPYVVVLYGKGRWLGPLLQGTEIDETTLFRLLAVIGADCECGLDPRLIRGRTIPIRWDGVARARAIEALGFDPENPMVRIEISQILRMRTSLYLESSSRRVLGTEEELPVPFVEDESAAQSVSVFENQIVVWVLYSVAGIGSLAVITGLLMMRILYRRNS